MASKRVGRSLAEQPPAKRLILESLVKELGLDISDYGDAPLGFVKELGLRISVPEDAARDEGDYGPPAEVPDTRVVVDVADVGSAAAAVVSDSQVADGAPSVVVAKVPDSQVADGATGPTEFDWFPAFGWPSQVPSEVPVEVPDDAPQGGPLDFMFDMHTVMVDDTSAPLPDKGPAEPVDLDQLCNDAYDHMLSSETVQQLGLNTSAPPKAQSVQVRIKKCSTPNIYPVQCGFKDFPLTKNGSKNLRIGLDAANKFSPFVLLLGDGFKTTNKVWLRLSPSELSVLMSPEIYSHIHTALESQTLAEPLQVGELSLTLSTNAKNKNFTTVCIMKKDSPIKIQLAESSWNMLHRLKENVEYHQKSLATTCVLAKTHFHHFISHCKDFCVRNKCPTPQSILDLKSVHSMAMLTNAARSYIFSFPQAILLDLVCYHLDFFKELIFTAMRK